MTESHGARVRNKEIVKNQSSRQPIPERQAEISEESNRGEKNRRNGYTVTVTKPQEMAEKSAIIRRVTTDGGDK